MRQIVIQRKDKAINLDDRFQIEQSTMSNRTRHFLALMKKNWIVWKRNILASLCELFCPLLLMSVLAMSRTLIVPRDYGTESHFKDSVFIAPLVRPTKSQVNVSDQLTLAMSGMGREYGNFSAFSLVNLTENNPIANFLPYHCTRKSDGEPLIIIAYSGNETYTQPVIRDLQQVIAIQRQKLLAEIQSLFQEVLVGNRPQKYIKKYMNRSSDMEMIEQHDNYINFTFKAFPKHDDILSYIGNPNYMYSHDRPGVCFGFSVTEDKPDNIDLKLAFSGTSEDGTRQSIPDQSLPVWSPLSIESDWYSYSVYSKFGYSMLHNWIANSVLRFKVKNQTAHMAITVIPFKTSPSTSDDYQYFLETNLPFFMLLIYILPVYRLISNIVSEKESKARESMKIMGLKDFSYWLSWFAYHIFSVTVISMMCVLILSFNVIVNSNKLILFLFFWIFGMSLFGFAVFIQSFFSRERIAAITGTLVYFGTSFINIVVSDPKIDAAYKYYASLISTVAVIRGSSVFSRFEIQGEGLHFQNLGVTFKNYTFENCLLIMIISFFLFLILGLYLDNVFPSVYGLRKQPWFFLKPSYWCKTRGLFTSRRGTERVSSGASSGGRLSGGGTQQNMTTTGMVQNNTTQKQQRDSFNGFFKKKQVIPKGSEVSGKKINNIIEEAKTGGGHLDNPFEVVAESNSPRQIGDDFEDLTGEYFEALNMPRDCLEPPSRELLRQEPENKILKVFNLMKTYDNGFQGVKGVNLRMFSGQIFALLGHNGAGKTTTVSMLTGLIKSTEGYAEIFGMDLFDKMDDVRQFLGVCPQHNILFENLTPREHLDIFCDFKGVSRRQKQDEIDKMLKDIKLNDHENVIAKNLSEGSKRKLSVAIALIGGSKLVLLDEPTSGMDLSSRRTLWNMLKNYKQGRIIILTTHYMDEADILGDRIGIMAEGRLICLGSSLFLKNRFGVGYNLTIVKKSKDEKSPRIEQYLKERLGSSIQVVSEVSSELTFQIPLKLSSKFKDFFERFDVDLDDLGIRSYGISVTTLEEVFLRVGGAGEHDTTKYVPDSEAPGSSSENPNPFTPDRIDEKKKEVDQNRSLSQNQASAKKEINFSIADENRPQKGACYTFFEQLGALFVKRYHLNRRNLKSLLVEIFIPVLIMIVGLSFSRMRVYFEQGPRPLVPEIIPLKQSLIVNNLTLQRAPNSTAFRNANLSPQQIMKNLPFVSDSFDVSYSNYTLNPRNLSSALLAMDNEIYESRFKVRRVRLGSYYIFEANNVTKQFKAVVFVNITGQEVGPLYSQFLYTAFLRSALNNPKLNFTVTTTPYPVTNFIKNNLKGTSPFFIVFFVSISFALIPAAMITFIMGERERNLKHMQLISGMSLSAYWISNIIFDVVKSLIPCMSVLGFMKLFGLLYPNIWLSFLLYPLAITPFSYATSFLFQKETLAQTSTIFLHFVFGGIGPIITVLLRMIDSTQVLGDKLNWILKIIPSFCLTDTVAFQSSRDEIFRLRPDLKQPSDYDITLTGGNVVLLCVHAVFWCVVLCLIESSAFSQILEQSLYLLKKNQIKENRQIQLEEDVLAEEKRVVESDTVEIRVRVKEFRKVYPSITQEATVAVEKMSFGMDYGECFAMLGVNGSGKSTTFKCLTNEFHPTQGSLTINGLNVQRDFSKVRSMIGYCPQYDSIFDWMSVEEHLWFYAKIKGIPIEFREDLIERQITEMNLQDHKFKAAGTLSGGNKRKLSVAIAILGNPPIVLLDEPSAGMDPEARRFMWQVVSQISSKQKKSAVILTTHAMDEAEALSTKMGIMVQGGIFKCLGSSSHIKEKYGTGYEIEIKVKKLNDQDIGRKLQQLQLRSNDHFTAQELSIILRRGHFNAILADQINEYGLGSDLYSEYTERGKVTAINFINWLYIEENGLSVIDRIAQSFLKVDILEHYNDYYKLRVPRGSKSIGYLFGLIETIKDQFCISEYSVGQTTLEQIFQQFANQRADECSQAKFSFELIGEHALLLGGGDSENRFEILNIEDQGENVRGSQYQQGLPSPHCQELKKQTSTMFRVISALSGKQDTKTVTITASDLDLDEQVVAERMPQARTIVKVAAIPDFLDEEQVFK